jgi:hypothetical protein
MFIVKDVSNTPAEYLDENPLDVHQYKTNYRYYDREVKGFYEFRTVETVFGKDDDVKTITTVLYYNDAYYHNGNQDF